MAEPKRKRVLTGRFSLWYSDVKRDDLGMGRLKPR